MLKRKIQALQTLLTPENVNNCNIPHYFQHRSGFTYNDFNELCTFFNVPNHETAPQTHIPLTYKRVDGQIQQMPLRQQFLFVPMKLQQNLDAKDLAFRFQIDVQSVGTLFNSWVDFMHGRLGQLSIWLHRDTITENMPDKSDCKTFAILSFTELKMENPRSVILQSQTCSKYKSLVTCDPRGSILFVSSLYSGSLSDKDIFQQCNIKELLQSLVKRGYLKRGDGLRADKGVLIEKDVKKIGLKWTIPPTEKSDPAVEITNKMAKHKLHMETAIAQIKKFKIVSGRIPNSRLGYINQIWFVVSMLSNFQPQKTQA